MIQRRTIVRATRALGKLRHSSITRMRAAGIAADVVAAWHGHTERTFDASWAVLRKRRNPP